jgi:hypothetical protein
MRFGPRTVADKKKCFAFLAPAFLVVAPMLYFLPALLFGKLIYGMDAITLGFPSHAEALRSLAEHRWPLWAPDLLGGMPGIAANNLMFLTPGDLLASLAGWTEQSQLALDAALWVAVSGLGMYLFLRRLDRSVSASLLGALFFCASGSQISQLFGGYYNFVEGIALAPWAFWAAHKACKEASWLAWGLCGSAFALQILAGATQIFAYTLLAVAALSLGLALATDKGAGPDSWPRGPRSASRWVRVWPVCGGLALALVLASLLSAPQLWLTLQYLPLSDRQGYTYTQFVSGSINPSAALMWLLPWISASRYYGAVFGDFRCTNLYFGLLPWALAAAALASLWRREALVRWMAALALAAFVVSLRQWTPLQWVFFHLPVFKSFENWSRVLFLVTLAGCTLAAFGWDALRATASRQAALTGAAAFSVFALLVAAFTWDGAWTAFILIPVGTGLLLFAARARASAWPWALVLALAFHGVDEGRLVLNYVRFVDPGQAAGSPRFLVPPPPPPGVEPWRIYDYDESLPNNAMVLGYENMCGLASMPPRAFLRIADAMGRRQQDWFNLFSVRYFFVHSKAGSLAPGDTVAVYENHRAFPRAWLVGRSRTVADDAGAYRLLSDPAFNPRLEVALEQDAGLGPAGAPPTGGVLWLSRDPQAYDLDVSTLRPAVLVLSNAWYPSWRASVDGRDTAVLKADGGLQAVLLGAGRHRVEFRFDPGLFYDALAACLAALVALVGLARYDSEKMGAR